MTSDDRMALFIRSQRIQLENLLKTNLNKYSKERLEILSEEISALKIREKRYQGGNRDENN